MRIETERLVITEMTMDMAMDVQNVASGRVLEKCGFETFFTGEGPYHDGVYEISKSVWKK